MPHPRPRKNRKTPSSLLLSLKYPLLATPRGLPCHRTSGTPFSPPQWDTLSTPLTPGLRNLSLMAAFAFIGNLGLVGMLFGRAIHLAHPSQWNTLRRNVNERDVRDAVQVFLRRNRRALASLDANEPDLTAGYPDAGEGSANEAIRALLDDALRAMAERRQQDFTRCLESIEGLVTYAMDQIEHTGIKWGTPGQQPEWPPLRELGRNLYSFREEVSREGHQEYVFKLSSLDFWLVHTGVNRRCGELFTTGLEGYRLNYQLSNRIGNAHWREIFRHRPWIEVHWLIVSEEAGEVFPYADAMVRLQENLLADAMHFNLPDDYEQLHTAFEAALQAIRYSWHVDSWPPPESVPLFDRLQQGYRIALMGLAGRAIILTTKDAIADVNRYLDVARRVYTHPLQLGDDIAQGLMDTNLSGLTL